MSINLRDYLTPPQILNRDNSLALNSFKINEKDPHLKIKDGPHPTRAVCKNATSVCLPPW